MQFSHINYNLYKSFLVVYETQNISRAGELLYISQPAVSHNIKELEKQLGVQLFYKKSSGMTATSEADALYKYISSAFNSIWKGETTISDMAGLKTGVVKIGAQSHIASLFLTDMVTEFRKKYPNIKIEIVSRPYSDLIAMLQTQNLDIVLSSLPIQNDKFKVEVKYLKSYSQCFFATDKFYTDSMLGIDALSNYPLIISSLASDEIKILKNAVPDLKLNPIIETWTTETLVRLVRSGNGIGFTQEDYIAEDVKNGTLKKFKTSFTLPKLDIYCGYVDEALAYAPKKFIEFLSTNS